MAGRREQEALFDPLTKREHEILCLIAEGLSNQEIADHFVISLGTVKGYVKLIFGKLQVNNRTEAVAVARANGILKDWNAPAKEAVTSQSRVNLPHQSTPFVGRDTELAALAEHLSNPACRLLNLIGAGGIGKTRLAVQAATRQAACFADGVFFVPLAPVLSPEYLTTSIADALHFTLHSAQDLKLQLIDHIGSKSLLMVLDNFEHLIEGVAVLSEILDGCPHVKMLVTSRERLNIQEEWCFHVEGLRYPGSEQAGRYEGANDPLETEETAETDAVKLFALRAYRIQPYFTLTNSTMHRAAERICKLVEGMPLAIKLATTWLRALSADEIAARIARDMDILTTSMRNVPERHRSIRAVFEQSCNLLDRSDQLVLFKLAVFRGGFSLDAAQQVAGATINNFATLIDKSLLHPEHLGRYDMHELLRQYAAEALLTCGEACATRDAHLDYFLHLAQKARPLLEQQEQSDWLHQLDIEHDNFRVALQWAMESNAHEDGLKLSTALGLFWFIEGYLREGLSHLQNCLSAGAGAHDALRAEAMIMAGMLARYHGDLAQAHAFSTEALQIARHLNDRHMMADALTNLGFVSMYKGDIQVMHLLYEEGLAINRELNNQQGIADCLSHLGVAACHAGDFAAARAYCGVSLQCWQSEGDQQGIAWAGHRLGVVLLHQGEIEPATHLFAQSLKLSQELNYQWGLVWSFENYARLAAMRQEHLLALELAGASDALRERIGLPLLRLEQIELERDLAGAHLALGEERAELAWLKGRALPLKHALARIDDLVSYFKM